MIELNELQTGMTEAYEQLAKQRELYFQASEAALAAKQNYNEIVMVGLLDGTVDGKNEKAREADAMTKFESEYSKMVDAETTRRKVENDFYLAKERVEYMRALLRLFEVMQT